MRGMLVTTVAFLGLASPLAAQTIPFTLTPSPRNHPACTSGNNTFSNKKWSVAEARTTATVSGATAVTLRKGADGVFGGTAKVGSSMMVFSFVNNGRERVLKVTSNELGCVWQGTNLDPRRA